MFPKRLTISALALPLITGGAGVAEVQEEDASLEITVSGIDLIEGQVRVAVFDNVDDFKSDECLAPL